MSDNKELHLLENYLSDNDITIFNYVDKLHEYNNFQILKETLDDRFYSLYTKKISKSKMNDNSYNFAGFLDIIDKKIYNPSYEIEKILENSLIYQLSELSKLKELIENEVSKKLYDYALSHISELKKICNEEFLKQDEYHFNYYQKEARKFFVSDENSQMNQLNPKMFLKYSYFADTYSIPYSEYLSDSNKMIKEIANNLIKNDKTKKNLG